MAQELFGTRKEAQKVLSAFIGWPKARVQMVATHKGNKYGIVAHAKTCKCGMCPMLRADGFMG